MANNNKATLIRRFILALLLTASIAMSSNSDVDRFVLSASTCAVRHIVAKVRLETQGSEKNIFFREHETLCCVGPLFQIGEIFGEEHLWKALEKTKQGLPTVRIQLLFVSFSTENTHAVSTFPRRNLDPRHPDPKHLKPEYDSTRIPETILAIVEAGGKPESQRVD
jgi:hypothetical protein